MVPKKATVRVRKTDHTEAQLVKLALRWLLGEIRNVDLCAELKRPAHNLAGTIATCMNALRRAATAGKVKIK